MDEERNLSDDCPVLDHFLDTNKYNPFRSQYYTTNDEENRFLWNYSMKDSTNDKITKIMDAFGVLRIKFVEARDLVVIHKGITGYTPLNYQFIMCNIDFFKAIHAKAKEEIRSRSYLQTVFWYKENRMKYRYNFVTKTLATPSGSTCASDAVITKEKIIKVVEDLKNKQCRPEQSPQKRQPITKIDDFPTNDEQMADQEEVIKELLEYIEAELVEPPQTYLPSESDPLTVFHHLNIYTSQKHQLAQKIQTFYPA
jgi:hypothetical protein